MSDADIAEAIRNNEIIINNFSPNSLTPVGYDLCVGDDGWIWTRKGLSHVEIKDKKVITLEPGDTALITTMEDIRISKKIMATIHSKVSLSSLGLSHISTTIDPGWGNKHGGLLLIQISNIGRISLDLNHGEPFCTVIFYRVITEANLDNQKAGSRDDVVQMIKKFIKDRKDRSRRRRLLSVVRSKLGMIILSLLAGYGGMATALSISSIFYPSLGFEMLVEWFFLCGTALSAAFMAVSIRRH
jgi:dCTP deaminase